MHTTSKEHLRHVLLYEFQKGSTASLAAKSLQNTYGNNVISVKTCRRWFSHFKKNDFTLKDEQRCGCFKGLNSEELLAVINEDPSKTSRELGIEFNVSHTSIRGLFKKYPTFFPLANKV